MTERFDGNNRNKFRWANEAAITELVKMFTQDLCRVISVDADLDVNSEISICGPRPNFLVVRFHNERVGIIEGKSSDDDGIYSAALSNEFIYSQMRQYLNVLRYQCGVENPFAILSTYVGWKVFWLKDLEQHNVNDVNVIQQ